MWQRVSVRASLAAMLLAGCAPVAALPTPTGAMWAFFTDAELTLGPRAVVYTISRVACEAERQRRAVPAPCVAVTVSPGTGDHAIELPSQFNASLPGGGIGTLDRDRCERLRMDLFRAFSAMGDCGPVAVTRAP